MQNDGRVTRDEFFSLLDVITVKGKPLQYNKDTDLYKAKAVDEVHASDVTQFLQLEGNAIAKNCMYISDIANGGHSMRSQQIWVTCSV